MNKQWKESAPSNIALIKYMGKEEGGANIATNPSLSMTLANFRTTVELSLLPEGSEDAWDPLPGAAPLRRESTQRFLDFFQRLKKQEGVHHSFLLRSGNNFPSDAGLASSASSFAALTKTAFTAFSELQSKPLPALEKLAMISRTGSGSSCRSFFSPWCVWEGEKIFVPPSTLPALEDIVVVLDSGFKKVSSSQAHQRVKSSPLFQGRGERSMQRLQQSLKALAGNDFRLGWQVNLTSWMRMLLEWDRRFDFLGEAKGLSRLRADQSWIVKTNLELRVGGEVQRGYREAQAGFYVLF